MLLAAAVVFLFDLAVPLGVAGGVPYVAVVLIGLWSPWRPMVFVLAALGTVLTIVGYVLSPEGGVAWVVLTNRALALFAIWATAGLVYVIAGSSRIGWWSLKNCGLCLLAAAVIFLFDLAVPLGVAGGVPYAIVVLIGLWSPWRPMVFVFAAFGTVLTLLGYMFSPEGGVGWVVLTNRALALFAIWATAGLAYVYAILRTDRVLRDSEARFRDLFEGSVLGMVVSRDFKPLFANQAFADIFGFDSPEEVLGLDSFIGLFAPHERKRIRGYSTKRRKSKPAPIAYECQGVRKDGAPLWLDIRVRVVDWEGAPAVQLSAVDITERKQAEDALRESEKQFRFVMDAMPALISYVDSDRVYRFVNKTYQDWFDVPREDIIGRSVREIHGEQGYAGLEELIDKVLSGERTTFEKEIPATPDGTRFIQGEAIPNFDRDGNVTGYFVLTLDITEARRATDALRAAKEDAEQANRAKSRFLAAASHDVRQPLHALGLFLGALAHRVRGKENRKIIDEMEQSLASMEALFNALLDVSKLDAGVVVPTLEDFPVSALLGPLARHYGPQAEEKGLRLSHVGSSAVVRSDRVLLNGVIGNLVANAVVHTGAGRVLVGCRRRGRKLRIEVHDTGPGIPANQMDRVFEEFHQLGNPARDRRLGLGLGLAIVDRTVKLLGHRLDVSSVPGHGSMFAVELPLGTARKVAPVEMPAGVGGGMTGAQILIVDDDRNVLDATTQLLSLWGCEVTGVTTANEAMKLAKNGSRPDLVIADYRLPGQLTGEEIIARISEGFPKPVPGIVVTGDTSPEVLRKVEASGYKLCHKSLRPAKLRALMEFMLAGRHQPCGPVQPDR